MSLFRKKTPEPPRYLIYRQMNNKPGCPTEYLTTDPALGMGRRRWSLDANGATQMSKALAERTCADWGAIGFPIYFYAPIIERVKLSWWSRVIAKIADYVKN